jgi:hypothetical protein
MGERPPPRETEFDRQRKWEALNPPPPDLRLDYKQWATLAKEQGKWIFYKTVKQWYTPEEFVAACENNVFLSKEARGKIELRNPVEGLEAAHKQIKDLNERLEYFKKKDRVYK